MNSILKELGINDINHGACTGKNNWFSNTNAKQLKSYNPSNGELIATVSMADESDYDKVVKTSKKAFSFIVLELEDSESISFTIRLRESRL